MYPEARCADRPKGSARSLLDLVGALVMVPKVGRRASARRRNESLEES